MTAAVFALGALVGVAAMMLLALWLAAKDAKPEAKQHQFSAVSAGDMDSAQQFHQIFKQLERGNGQTTRH